MTRTVGSRRLSPLPGCPHHSSGRVLLLESPTQTAPNPSSQTVCPPQHCSQLQSPFCPWHCSSMAPWGAGRAPVQHPWCTHLAECPCGTQSLGHGGSPGVPAPAAEHPSHTIAVGGANPCYPNKQQMEYPALPTHQHHGLSRLRAGGISHHAGTHSSTASDPSTILFWVCWRFF